MYPRKRRDADSRQAACDKRDYEKLRKTGEGSILGTSAVLGRQPFLVDRRRRSPDVMGVARGPVRVGDVGDDVMPLSKEHGIHLSRVRWRRS